MKNNTLPRLREILVDNCEDALKQEALSLYNEIEEALEEAHEKARIDKIQELYNLVEGARILPSEYDAAIEGGIQGQGLLLYSAEKCIRIIYLEMLEAIKQGDMDLYGDDMSAEDSAYIYAQEHYEFNVSGDLSPNGPLFLNRFHEEEAEERGAVYVFRKPSEEVIQALQ